MRFLADMGLSRSVTDWLRASGHEATHLSDEGLARLPDNEIFLKADREKKILLTFDLDFGEILALMGDWKVSVVLFRLHNTRSANVTRRLAEVLAVSADALQQGAIIIVEEMRHRVRRLPFRETHRQQPL